MKIEYIIIHCSDSEWGCARAIREWHTKKPNPGWKDIGYHFVIQNGFPTHKDLADDNKFCCLDGQIECGRYLDGSDFLDENEVGSHALGYNRNSVGICLIGKKDFTHSQQDALISLCEDLMIKYDVNVNNIIGHCETEEGMKQGKTCPNIDMNDLRDTIRKISYPY